MTFSQGLTEPLNSQWVFKKFDQKKKTKTGTMAEKQIQRNEYLSLSCLLLHVQCCLKFDTLKFLFLSYYDKKGVYVYFQGDQQVAD